MQLYKLYKMFKMKTTKNLTILATTQLYTVIQLYNHYSGYTTHLFKMKITTTKFQFSPLYSYTIIVVV